MTVERGSVGERALRRMARRCLVSEPRLLEVLSSPIGLLEPVTDGSLSDLLSEVLLSAASFLPEKVSVGEVSVGASGVVSAALLCDGGPDAVLVAAPLRDSSGVVWVSAGGLLVTGIGADGEFDIEHLEMLSNRLNDVCPVGCWGVLPDGLVLSGGCVAALEDSLSESWLRQVASAAVDVVAYADVALRMFFDSDVPGPLPVSVFRWEEESFLRAAGEVFCEDDIGSAFESFVLGLPPLLAAGVESASSVDGLLIKVPFPSGSGDPCISLLLSLSAQAEGSSIPSGVHLSAEVPLLLEHSDAVEWVSRLNGYEDSGSSSSPLLSTWQACNWYHAAGPGGMRRLMFYAVVPDRVRGSVDLGQVLSGLVREVCHSAERLVFTRRFASIMGDGGYDA